MLRIRDLRAAHRPPLSQERLAALAGITVATERRAEKTGDVSMTTLRKLATALGVPVADLFEKPTEVSA